MEERSGWSAALQVIRFVLLKQQKGDYNEQSHNRAE